MASIKNLGNGKFRVIISDGYTLKGERRRVTKTIQAKSMRDAEKQAIDLASEVQKNKVEHNNNVTFSELIDKYRMLKEPNLTVKVIDRYEGIIKNFLLPAFGRKKVKDIKPLHIEQYLAELDKDGIRIDGKSGGYHQKTKLHHYTLLHKLFVYACNWGFITNNPCDRVDPPRVNKTEAKCYQIEQVKQLLELSENVDIKYKVFLHIALFAGMRRSEIMGLEFKDFNYINNTVRICRTSQYSKSKGIFTTNILKNGEPSRTVNIPETTMKLVKEYYAWQQKYKKAYGDGWKECDRLFTKEDGSPMHPDTPYQWFTKFLKANNMPELTVHQLRHTNVSILLSNNVDIVTIAKQHGHDPYTMLTTYAHLMNKACKEGAEKLENEFYK